MCCVAHPSFVIDLVKISLFLFHSFSLICFKNSLSNHISILHVKCPNDTILSWIKNCLYICPRSCLRSAVVVVARVSADVVPCVPKEQYEPHFGTSLLQGHLPVPFHDHQQWKRRTWWCHIYVINQLAIICLRSLPVSWKRGLFIRVWCKLQLRPWCQTLLQPAWSRQKNNLK